MVNNQGSNLLLPYKSVGLITEDLPFAVNQLGTETFITVSLGRSFQVYKCDKLTPVIVSPQMHDTITCLAVQREFTYVAIGKDILVWRRITQFGTMSVESGIVNHMLVLGEYLIATDTNGHITIFNTHSFEIIRTITLSTGFIPTTLCHPNTYINKVLVGSIDGQLELWNIRKGTLIMKFKGYSSGISVLENAPALDTVCVGLIDGTIDILNLKVDRSVVSYKQPSAVTSLSFRQDPASIYMMATADIHGYIYIWDVEKKKLHYSLKAHHDQKIISIAFIPDHPHLVSIGSDNAIHMYILDQADGVPRLLKHREGHMTTPNKIRFYGDGLLSTDIEGGDARYLFILSGGSEDRQFRGFNVIKETLNVEFSQGHVAKKAKQYDVEEEELKLNPIIDFSMSENREKDWANIVTVHTNTIMAYLWSMKNKNRSKLTLSPPPEIAALSKDNYCRCCVMDLSGERCICGYTSGHILMYNIQSGIYRGSLPKEAKKGWVPPQGLIKYVQGESSEMEGPGRHEHCLVGIDIDKDNKLCISADIHGYVKIWNILEQTLVHEIVLDRDIYKITLHRDSGLLAVACSDNIIYLYDIYLYTCVRRFMKNTEPIIDMSYSADGRWLVTCDESRAIIIYDVISGTCIDWCVTPYVCTSICFSPNSEFLACAYQGKKNIYIYANKGYFGDIYSNSIPKQPYRLEFPEDYKEEEEQEMIAEEDNTEPPKNKKMTVNELEDSIVLSNQPATKWTSLVYLDIIKERNKPIQPPKEPEAAPFFLSTLPGLTPVFADIHGEQEEEEQTKSRIIERKEVSEILTELQTLLYQCEKGIIPTIPASMSINEEEEEEEEVERRGLGLYIYIINYFRSLSPSGIDKQLYSLCSGIMDSKGVSSLCSLMRFFVIGTQSRRDFDMLQAIINRTLQIYGDILRDIQGMPELLKELQTAQESTWNHLEELYQNSLCLVELFANLQM
ncbi:hypothetical protein WA158_006119 [Blastocystis sp. Blastoise]